MKHLFDCGGEFLRQAGTVVCRSPRPGKHWLALADPELVLIARTPAEIAPLLGELERHLAAGRWVAGALAYEAAPAFDAAHRVHPPAGPTPLAWFGVYSRPRPFSPPPAALPRLPRLKFTPAITRADYLAAVGRVKTHLYAGDIYQANLTFPALAAPLADPAALFLTLFQSHPVTAAAWLNAGPWQLVSLSPEIYLVHDGRELRSWPMKGTARRELSAVADRRAARELARDPKNRAENVMITDMVRNDLGRICRPGSIRVEALCRVETYATVHQMISVVRGRPLPGVSLADMLGATFPPASITGAPKIRAMQIIHELEPSPRRFYTGSIGVFAPDGTSFLNVTIRTLLCLPERTELGIGSGIVADSNPAEEWRECLLKSRFVYHRQPQFELLETMLWTRAEGLANRAQHLARARRSQHYFGRPWRIGEIRPALDRLEQSLAAGPAKFARIRLCLDSAGHPRLETQPLPKVGWGQPRLTIRLAARPVSSRDLFLYHKTTRRHRYDREFRQAQAAGCDEVIFHNERGELTEGAISNLLVQRNGQWYTPPIRCGLLPGIWRAAAIREFRAKEKILTVADLAGADQIMLGNSVRGPAPVGQIRELNRTLRQPLATAGKNRSSTQARG